MGYSSKDLLKFQRVVEGLKKLPEPLDGELSTDNVEKQVAELEAAMQRVESLRKELAKAINERNRIHKEVSKLMGRVRSMVRGKYGPDSDEYELVGGTRLSEYKHPSKN